MKTWRYLIFIAMAAMAVASCKKEEKQKGDEPGPGPVVEDISGAWALAGEDYRVQEILEIEKERFEGCFSILAPEAGCYFYQDEVYGDIEGEPVVMGVACTITSGKISVPVDGRGYPEIGRWEEPPAGFEVKGNVCEATWSLSGKTLTLGGRAYKKVTRFVGETYSSITTTLEDNTITVGSEEQVVHIPYTISPAVPWGELTATKGSASFIGNVAYGEGEVLVSVSAVQSAVSGDVTLHYPGAPDLAVTIRREITRAIVPEWTEKTFDYRQRGYESLTTAISLPFSIINPSSAYQPGIRVEGDPDWIYGFINSANEACICIAENNSGASRTAKLLLMYYSESGSDEYPPAPEVPVTITQTYDAPVISFESATGEIDFRAQEEITVPLTVKNPRDNWEVLTETEADWLYCSANTEYLYLSVNENQSDEARTATITLRYHSWYEIFEDVVATYTLTQRGIEPVVTLVADEITTDFHNKGQLHFYYNILNGTGNETFTDDADWIWYPNKGGWDNDRNCWWGWIQLDANHTTETRTGHVTITDGNSSAVLTVIQTGVQSAIAMDSELNLDYSKATIHVNFELLDSSLDEGQMQAESSADWLVPKWREWNNGSRSYRCEVDYNNSGATREATLTLSIGTESSTLRIIQTYTAPIIYVEPESLSAGYESESIWMKCYAGYERIFEEMTYECDADWVSFTPDRNGTMVNVTENKTNLARTATINISYIGLATKTVTVTQGIRDYFDLVLTRQDDPGRGTQYHINWASCNVGATGGDKIGNYYNYSQAQSNLPSGTRLPTLGEWNDFQHAFTWTKTTVGGVVGFVATPKDESNAWIDMYFIPASGYYPIVSPSVLSYTDRAFYWSSYPDPNWSNYYWCAWFYYHSDQYGTIATRDPYSASDRIPVRVVK
ncbi:MAG: BACON domain-containing protein [Bacteroidales bacterium]|nr:BACON domain-containing protein [Bacteroidales bacterium]